ncbi:GAF and ANTAR domain-containing protein [Streptomyces fumanus]|uniref:GAF and ANTAR domain-containing protein n=1 Tax=Streptomyces fumanus TaxID=67302 RepID=UPI0033D94B90
MDDDQLTGLWRRIADAGDITLGAACDVCAADLAVDCAGITLIDGGELRTLGHATDDRARRLEDNQLVTGEGPCTEAFVRQTLVESADLHDSYARWPAFTPVAVEQGVRSVTALPLTIGRGRIGAVDLYRTAPGQLTEPERERARGYARILTLLALDSRPGLLALRQQPLRPGPQGFPPHVHAAAGVLAERYALPPDDALARMRAHAFRHGQPLSRTAEHVLAHRSLD